LRDKLAVLRPSANGAQVGFWSPADGRQVDPPFREVPIRRNPAGGQPSGGIGEAMPLVAVMLVLMVVYWVRRESLAMPVLIPPGPTAATLGRRGIAALIDAAPAAAVTLAFWWKPVMVFWADYQTAQQNKQMISAAPMFWPWMTLVGLYSVYTAVVELVWSVTPGKRLMGCQVVSETLEKPAPAQVIIRNAARLLELEPHLSIWPFLLVVFMTRNRQRVGDLLARTIVVEPGEGQGRVEDPEAARK
jgi:uncharacterized RDD family membrane protein YckC